MKFFKKSVIVILGVIVTMSSAVHAVAEEYTIPDIDSDFKSYMDYRCIKNTRSPQYKLQQYAYTDDNGLRMVDDYYVVALGTYYSDTIGDCFLITLASGDSFKVIVGDIKDNRHTDDTNRYKPMSEGKGNIIEFVVDTKTLDSYAKRMGTISVLEGFEGSVESIEKIEFDEKCPS